MFPGFSPEDWSSKRWLALANKSLVFPTHISQTTEPLETAKQPKKDLVQRIPLEAWIFGATCVFPAEAYALV